MPGRGPDHQEKMVARISEHALFLKSKNKGMISGLLSGINPASCLYSYFRKGPLSALPTNGGFIFVLPPG
jgi:hypothetical protein